MPRAVSIQPVLSSGIQRATSIQPVLSSGIHCATSSQHSASSLLVWSAGLSDKIFAVDWKLKGTEVRTQIGSTTETMGNSAGVSCSCCMNMYPNIAVFHLRASCSGSNNMYQTVFSFLLHLLLQTVLHVMALTTCMQTVLFFQPCSGSMNMYPNSAVLLTM